MLNLIFSTLLTAEVLWIDAIQRTQGQIVSCWLANGVTAATKNVAIAGEPWRQGDTLVPGDEVLLTFPDHVAAIEISRIDEVAAPALRELALLIENGQPVVAVETLHGTVGFMIGAGPSSCRYSALVIALHSGEPV